MGMGITDGNLLYCHSVAEGKKDKKISTLEYNNRTDYDCFNNPFTVDFGIPDMHLPPITIDDRPPLPKRARYAPNLLPATISVASENPVSTLTTPSDLPDILTTVGQKIFHVLKKGLSVNVRVHRGYCCRKHGRIRCYKKTRFYCSICSDEDRRFYYCQRFSSINVATRACFLEHQHTISLGYG